MKFRTELIQSVAKDKASKFYNAETRVTFSLIICLQSVEIFLGLQYQIFSEPYHFYNYYGSY